MQIPGTGDSALGERVVQRKESKEFSTLSSVSPFWSCLGSFLIFKGRVLDYILGFTL